MTRHARTLAPSGLIATLALLTLAAGLHAPAADAKAKPAVRAKVAKKTLSVTGGKRRDVIVLRLKKRAPKIVEVDVGGNGKADFRFRRASFKKIVVRGGNGNDVLRIDERNGVFTKNAKTTLKGDAGNDQIAGGAGAESISGGTGNDTVDTGAGNDRAALGAGDDVLRSDPAAGSDRVQGDGGNDHVALIGSGAADDLAAAPAGGRLRIARGGAVAVDADDVENLDISALGGPDSIRIDNLAGTDVANVNTDLASDSAPDTVTVNGTDGGDNAAVTGSGGSFRVSGLASTISGTGAQPGQDRLTIGGQGGNDVIDGGGLAASAIAMNADGGPGTDTLTGGEGTDALTGGPDDDTFNWSAGNARIEGQGGSDRLVVSGSGGDDSIDATAADGRVRISRAGQTADADDVESASIDGSGGADSISIGDLSGTDLVQAAVESADGASDHIAVTGTPGDDHIAVDGSGADVAIAGTTPSVKVHPDAGDELAIDSRAGADNVDARGLAAGVVALALNGGDDSDVLFGTAGADSITGGGGNDAAQLGEGDDTYRSIPADGSDLVEGQGGTDRLLAIESDGDDQAAITANGARLRFDRAADGTVIDADDVETVDTRGQGGSDSTTVGDMAGTDVKNVNVDAGEGGNDTVVATATQNADTLGVATGDAGTRVTGLAASITITGSQAADDGLTLNALGASDNIDATGLSADAIALTVNGGLGNDVLLGGPGGDTFTGGDGADTGLMGGGDDTFVWSPGDDNDTIEGQAGAGDRMLFNGANVSERIDISANGGRVRFARDVANVVMDLNGTEKIDFRALSGADNITVGDMSGTDLTSTNVNLSGPQGGGDGAADTVTVNGTNGADIIAAAGDDTGTSVAGLPSRVTTTGAEQANDHLTLNAQGGSDTVDATAMAASAPAPTVNGGLGADVILGGAGADLINGGDGDDVAFMGAGDDVFVWNPGDDNDTIEGQAGNADRMLFNGANIAENIDVSANGGRVRFSRNVANVVMDLNDTEQIDFNAGGGVDNIVLNDLSGTDLKTTNLNLASFGTTSGDGAADSVTVTGTSGDDAAVVAGDASGVVVAGLASTVNITGNEAANDRLTVNALAGDDVVEGSGLTANSIRFTADGGDNADILIGGDGNDTLIGGNGDDVLIGGPGNDVLDGGTGSNVLIQ